MDEIIAEYECRGIDASGKKIEIAAQVGKPYLVNERCSEWACPISLTPLYRNLSGARGVNSLQSVCLATDMLIYLLEAFVENGGNLIDDDGRPVSLESFSMNKVQSIENGSGR